MFLYVLKVAHLQFVVVVKAVWGIFDNTNDLYLQVNTLLVIYKSRYYSINGNCVCKVRFVGELAFMRKYLYVV